MKVVNIKWNIDMDEVFEKLDNMTSKNAANELGIPSETYSNMTTTEKHDYAYDYFHHCPGALDDFMNLPSEIELPKEIEDDEDISDWLSDVYGFCHEGFELVE